jgi:hypothetical protein
MLEPMFQMGFMGIVLQPFIKFCLKYNKNVKTYPKALYKSKFGCVHTKLRPMKDMCNVTRCMQLESPITPCTLVGFE